MSNAIVLTNQFKKDYRQAIRRGMNIELLDTIVGLLANGIKPDGKHKDHLLTGRWRNCRECHILPDWLLIYQVDDQVHELTLIRTGSHSDLF